MKAIQVRQPGGLDSLHEVEIDLPVPAPNQVLVEVRAIGVNYVDIYYREGIYPAPLPFTPGQEGSGVIVEAGSEVENFRPGDRVAWCMYLGAYAQYAAVPQAHLVHLPESINFEQAAGILLQGMTAQYLTASTFPLKRGDVALVHAGAGGVGLLLIQMAVRAGAQVITTVSTEAKAELARSAGAQHIILYEKVDFEHEVRRITANRGVDVVYDSVGKATFEHSLRCLRPRGMMVLYGASSGPVSPVDPVNLSLRGSLYLTRPSLSHYTLTRNELDERSSQVFQALERGDLRLRIHQTFPLSQAARAQEELQSRRTTGKLLLIP